MMATKGVSSQMFSFYDIHSCFLSSLGTRVVVGSGSEGANKSFPELSLVGMKIGMNIA